MITQIDIVGCGSYGKTPEILPNLKSFNFIYGPTDRTRTKAFLSGYLLLR
jgi:hypothetical protein